jgi:hypothetical protein
MFLTDIPGAMLKRAARHASSHPAPCIHALHCAARCESAGSAPTYRRCWTSLLDLLAEDARFTLPPLPARVSRPRRRRPVFTERVGPDWRLPLNAR